MGLEAATKALLDAGGCIQSILCGLTATSSYFRTGINYDAVEMAFVGFCYGDSTSGQVSIL